MNVRLILAYDGTHYLGWQKTHAGPSIEGVLETILSQILQEEIVLQAASRTDAGVHAEGQVVNFRIRQCVDLKKLHYSLNRLLPKDISTLHLEEAPAHFHPTLDALGKEYHYYLCNSSKQLPFHRHFSWHFPYPLDLNKLRQGAALLLGTHDFAAFCNKTEKKETVRTLTALEIVELPYRRLKISIQGDRFLYRMVRNLVGTLAHIGCNKLPLDSIPLLLQQKKRADAGITAPAHGLTLHKINF